MPGSRVVRPSDSYCLDPAMPVLSRPDGAVQVGWDPRRAVLVRPPTGLSTAALTELLLSMRTPVTLANLQEHADSRGDGDGAAVEELLGALLDAGVLRVVSPRRTRSAAIRVHGRGPLSDLLLGGLRCSGSRVVRTSRKHAIAPEDTDLVVLADYLVVDPRVVRELHHALIPHLAVRVRDGTGLVGPLVIPGSTSCLECADLHRTDRDAAWPAVAAQLRDNVGNADRATVLATAALALDQVDRVVRAVQEGHGPHRPDDAPPTLDTTLEFDVHTQSISSRRWSRHPRCSC